MSINLEKGGRINLSKEMPSLNKVRVGLGWEANQFDTGGDFDIDVSLFMLAPDTAGNAKLPNEKNFIFYGNLVSPDGSVRHSGDNKVGGSGDLETLFVELGKVDPKVAELSIVCTIYKADERKQNFGQIRNSYVQLYNDDTGEAVARYQLEDEFSVETAIQVGSLYRKDGHWFFKAVGAGYKKGLADFVRAYGADAEGD